MVFIALTRRSTRPQCRCRRQGCDLTQLYVCHPYGSECGDEHKALGGKSCSTLSTSPSHLAAFITPTPRARRQNLTKTCGTHIGALEHTIVSVVGTLRASISIGAPVRRRPQYCTRLGQTVPPLHGQTTARFDDTRHVLLSGKKRRAYSTAWVAKCGGECRIRTAAPFPIPPRPRSRGSPASLPTQLAIVSLCLIHPSGEPRYAVSAARRRR